MQYYNSRWSAAFHSGHLAAGSALQFLDGCQRLESAHRTYPSLGYIFQPKRSSKYDTLSYDLCYEYRGCRSINLTSGYAHLEQRETILLDFVLHRIWRLTISSQVVNLMLKLIFSLGCIWQHTQYGLGNQGGLALSDGPGYVRPKHAATFPFQTVETSIRTILLLSPMES